MKTTTLPTLDELNATHAAWIAMDSTTPDRKKRQIMQAMESRPMPYASMNADATGAVINLPGQPMQAYPIALDKARKILEGMNARTDVAWHGETGKYIAWPTN